MDAIKQIYTHLNLRGNQIIGLRPEVSPEEPDYIEGGIYYNPARKTFYGGVSGAWTPFGVSQDLLDKIDTLLDYWSLENGVLKTDYPMMARGYAAGATASVGEGGGGGGAILNKESIITALGYTPYDSANPKDYITVSALTGYATQDYVSQQISNIDLSPYAKTEDVAAMYVTRDSFSPIEDYYNAISPNIYKVGDLLKIESDIIANNNGQSSVPLWIKGTDTWAGARFNSGFIGYFGGFDWRVTNEGYGQDSKLLHEQNYSKYALPLTGGWLSSPESNTPLTVSAPNATTTIFRVVNGNVAGTLSVSSYLALGLSGGSFPQIQISENEDSPIWRKNFVNKHILHEGNYSQYALSLSGGILEGDLILLNNKLSFVNATLSNDDGLAMKYSSSGEHEFYTSQGKKILSLSSSIDRVTIYDLGIDSELGPVPSLTVGGAIKANSFILGNAGDVFGFSQSALSIGSLPSGYGNNVHILNLCGYDRIDFTLLWDKRMSILSNGNVLIGTTTDNGAKLQVNGGITVASTLKIGDATISYVNGVLKVDKPFMSKGYAAGATASVSSSGGGVILNKESIIEALGYTPYDAANPSNYTTRSAIFTGSASQFLKADGSVDSTAYLSTAGGNINGTLVIDGILNIVGNGSNTIRTAQNPNSSITNMPNNDLVAIRHAIGFKWYDTEWQIGNIRGGGTGSVGFGITKNNDTCVFRVSESGAKVNENTVLHSGNYATEIGDYYLKSTDGIASGLKITGSGTTWISFREGTTPIGSIGVSNDYKPVFWDVQNGMARILLHSGNVGEYAALAKPYGIDVTTTNLNQIGYGNSSGGWITNGPAIAVGSDNGYTMLIQQSANNNSLLVSYKTADGTVGTWKYLAFTNSTVAAANKLVTSAGADALLVDNSKHIYTSGYLYSDRSGDSVTVLDYGPDGMLLLGYGIAGAGLETHIYGKTIKLRGGTSRTIGLVLNESGNVTIGNGDSAGASYKLWAAGDARIEGSITMSGELKFMDGYSIQSYNNSPLSINAHGNNILLGPNGNIKVGVCTDNPQYNLDVNGTMGAYESLNFTKPSWNYITVPTTNGALAFNVGAAGIANTKMCIDKSGNVGIGTTSPEYKLDVAGQGRFTGAVTMASTLAVGASAFFSATHFNGHAFFNSGGEGIYISDTGQSINWHDADNAHVITMMGFAWDNITIHRDLLPSADKTHNLGNASLWWNNLFVKNIDVNNLYASESTYSEGYIHSDAYITTDGYVEAFGDVRTHGFLQAALGVKIADISLSSNGGALTINAGITPTGHNVYSLGAFGKGFSTAYVNTLSSGAANNNLWLVGGDGTNSIGIVFARNAEGIPSGAVGRWNAVGLYPNGTNIYALGQPSNRWSTIYGVHGNFSGNVSPSVYGNGSLGTPSAYWGNVYSLFGQFGDSVEVRNGIECGSDLTVGGNAEILGILTVSGEVKANSLKIGDATITWDATKGVLKIDKPIAGQGYVAGATATAN